MSEVVDLARKDEPKLLEQSDIDKFYIEYKRWCHEDPPWEEDPTAEQITGVDALLKDRLPPYVDLSVFGPYGQRIQRNMKLMSLQINHDDELVRVEIKGPPTVARWELCMRVFATTMIGLGAMTPPTINGYIKLIVRYASRYGPSCWGLIYQTDVRFRREWCERLRRLEASKLIQATNAGGVYPYDPKQPWEQVYNVGINGDAGRTCWHDELEEPCQCICAKAKTAGTFLEGDAPVANAGRDHVASNGAGAIVLGTDGGDNNRNDRRAPPRRETSYERPTAKARVMRKHSVGSDGYMIANRAGTALCVGWQTGECRDTGPHNRCGADNSRMHQCARCLAPNHGASYPRQCEAPQAQSPREKGKGGGGKGKGGKSGRGGKVQ